MCPLRAKVQTVMQQTPKENHVLSIWLISPREQEDLNLYLWSVCQET